MSQRTPRPPGLSVRLGVTLAMLAVLSGGARPPELADRVFGPAYSVAVALAAAPGAVQLARSWPGIGPLTNVSWLLNQDTGAPFNVADQRECSSAKPPVPLTLSEPEAMGEFFGFATAH